jgi:diaminopimelate epimerase
MGAMRFAKLHGLGNDFVLLDRRAGGELPSTAEAIALCDRHRGVGADGVLTLLPPPVVEAGLEAARLVIHNPDGSQPEMCGNGARCAALWVATGGLTVEAPRDARVRLFTAAGVRDCAVDEGALTEGQVEIAMGVPRLGPPVSLVVEGAGRAAHAVSMGNPHRVMFFGGEGDRVGAGDGATSMLALAARAGEALCLAEDANIEFVRKLAPQAYEVAVWERGAGLTLACGTGACAVAAAALAANDARPDLPIDVRLPGGTLRIRRETGSGELLMRGAAAFVFAGEWVVTLPSGPPAP